MYRGISQNSVWREILCRGEEEAYGMGGYDMGRICRGIRVSSVMPHSRIWVQEGV